MRDGMRLRMIVTDLDGTMLYQKNQVSERNYDAICRARKEGCLYVAATGRCEGIVPKEALPPLDYTITCNGAVIIRQSDGKRLCVSDIPAANAREALRVIRKYRPFLEMFVKDNILLEQETNEHLGDYWVPEFHMSYFQSGKQRVAASYEDFLDTDGRGINKINLPCREYGKLGALWRELKEMNMFCVSSDGHGIEITNPFVDKGNALQTLCGLLEIPMEETAAFGDGANDVNMLRKAGYGVAMENAIGDAKAAAHYQTCHHREDGVAVFLEDTFGI